MDILLLDIERAPMLVDSWGLFNQNHYIQQIRDHGGLLCFAAKWLGDPKWQTEFYSDHQHGRELMAEMAHKLLDQADAVMTWYGKKHDIPALNNEFLELGFRPPSPYRQIDLYQVVKRNFLFPSNKLDYVSQVLGFNGKVSHEGHMLWVKCMDGDPEAWAKMEEYNKQDVWMLEEIYGRVQPWIDQHPSHAIDGGFVCPKCGSADLQRRGTARTLVSEYQRYQCQACGGWSRDVKRTKGAALREVYGG
jgi:predicted RNA-binding Zn-ribbon protein involved in translation (DUF1610 family)